jgi:membrane associated rhomboid family serine protease
MVTPSELMSLNWGWIALMATAPLLVGLLVAWPVWKAGEPILGNLAATALIFAAAFALILRENTAIDRLTRQCYDAGYVCRADPSSFVRFAIYAGIGLFQEIVIFMTSLRVERRLRNRGVAPEWHT